MTRRAEAHPATGIDLLWFSPPLFEGITDRMATAHAFRNRLTAPNVLVLADRNEGVAEEVYWSVPLGRADPRFDPRL